MGLKWESEWEKIYQQHGEIEYDVLPSVRFAAEIFKRKGCLKIMDLGCGTGRHSIFLAANGFEVTATDISKTGLEITNSKAEKLNFNNIHIAQHDMREMPFENQFFDGILCVWTTGHGTLQDARQHVHEMYRVLKPSGIVIIDYISTEDENFNKGIEIETNTFINNMEGEEKIPHHYTTVEEIRDLYQDFMNVDIMPIDYNFMDQFYCEHMIKAYMVIATK